MQSHMIPHLLFLSLLYHHNSVLLLEGKLIFEEIVDDFDILLHLLPKRRNSKKRLKYWLRKWQNGKRIKKMWFWNIKLFKELRERPFVKTIYFLSKNLSLEFKYEFKVCLDRNPEGSQKL